jgi:hypothetical protein
MLAGASAKGKRDIPKRAPCRYQSQKPASQPIECTWRFDRRQLDTFERGSLPRGVCHPRLCGPAQCTAASAIQIQTCCPARISQFSSVHCSFSYLKLPQVLLVFATPSHGQIHAVLVSQRALNPSHRFELVDIHQLPQALVFHKLLGALHESVARHVIHEQTVQSRPTPSLVSDVCERRNAVEVFHMLQPSMGLLN